MMGTLEYQHGGEASKEQRKQLRMKWFGPSKAEVWKKLAEEIDARFVPGTWWKGDRVVAEVGPWEIVLDTYMVDKVIFTRLRAPYVNADGFRFRVFRKHFFSGLAERLGFQDVAVGQPHFDEQFVIRGNHEGKLRRLFANERIREMLLAQPKVDFHVKDDEGTFRKKFPEGVDALCFVVGGVVKDLDRLGALYELFAETLQELCRMGSAYDRGPGVEI